MVSNFKRIAMEIINTKETGVYNPEDKVRDIESGLDGGSIKLDEAMNKLKDVFSYKLSSDDYRKIERETGYNLN